MGLKGLVESGADGHGRAAGMLELDAVEGSTPVPTEGEGSWAKTRSFTVESK